MSSAAKTVPTRVSPTTPAGIGTARSASGWRLKPGLRRHPLALRAVPIPAGVVGDTRVGTVFAALDMTAKRSGATYLYGRHDAPLGKAQMSLVSRAPAGTVAAENIRHLQSWPRHSRRIRLVLPSPCSEVRAGSGFAGWC